MQEKKKSKKILGKAGILVIALAVISTVSLSGCTELNKFFGKTETAPTGGAIIECATFSVVPSVSASNGVLDAAKTTITIPFYANSTSHVIDEGDNTTWVEPIIRFVISPMAYPGATLDDMAICHYEVMNPSQTVGSSSGTYYILAKSSNQWQATWTGDGTNFVSGTTQMAFTGNKTLVLTLDIDNTGLSYTQSTYSAQTLTIRFYNDCGWSYIVDIDFIATKVGSNVT